VGIVGRAVGLRGEVEVSVQSDHPERFAVGASVLVRTGLRALRVATVRRNRRRTIVSFVEIADRAAAEALKGAELVIAAEDARELEPGEYWDHDLVGCVVITVDAEEVGTVTDVLHASANDVLVVTDGDRERLIPLVGDVVKSVEPGHKITIDPTPGLLD
jgi:16S rRNA processing protein RimM